MLPRCVLIERPTEYRELLARHGSREQVRFFLRTRGQRLDEVERRHLVREEVRAEVLAAVPPDWRTSAISRSELDRFLFEEDDVIVVLGQDGLVANAAKYLSGQPVIGLNPEPERIPGVLVAHPPQAAADLLRDVARGRAQAEHRTMAEASLDDGQRLLALNEVFVGHASHQSARYALSLGEREEHQSSSGLIVATGTGATGWAASMNLGRAHRIAPPAPTDPTLALFVREAWPSAATGTELTEGLVGPGEAVEIRSELAEGGVVFGDGIEGDALALDWGARVRVRAAAETLRLVR